MPWPDIFWKGRKPKPEPEPTPTVKPTPEPVKPSIAEAQPPTIKPVPATATVGPQNVPVAVPAPAASTPAPSPVKVEAKPEAKTAPTLPATHGVVLRPPTGRTTPAAISSPAFLPPRAVAQPPRTQEPLKNIEQLMAEADPVQTLRQTGNVRVLKPLTGPDTAPLPTTPASPAPVTPPARVEPGTTVKLTPQPPESPSGLIVPPPSFRPTVTSPQGLTRLISTPAPTPITRPAPAPEPPPASVVATPVPTPEDNDSPFILKPGPVASSAPIALPTPARSGRIMPPTAPLTPVSSILRRKARMADVARIVLPPKREDTQVLHPAPAAKPMGPSPTVVPPAFPVVAMTARATQQLPRPLTTEPAPEKIVDEDKPVESILKPVYDEDESFILKPEKSEPVKTEPVVDKAPEPVPFPSTPAPEPEKPVETKVDVVPVPEPIIEAKLVEPLIGTTDAPKVDSEAHKPEPTATPEPKVDPEAHKPTPPPPEKAPADEPVTTVSTPPEKREFHLANGERVAGTVISETPESVYIEHATLGVLTIPRANIAKRLVEIILINGDRIVGDIMAETPDTLYVRHASLGMLTVPRAQRSTRVVEAILKDGDRILGEVLTETDTFTVIRSATLGTITVPHTKLAMLNRKVEQVEMKALPPPVPELKDK